MREKNHAVLVSAKSRLGGNSRCSRIAIIYLHVQYSIFAFEFLKASCCDYRLLMFHEIIVFEEPTDILPVWKYMYQQQQEYVLLNILDIHLCAYCFSYKTMCNQER